MIRLLLVLGPLARFMFMLLLDVGRKLLPLNVVKFCLVFWRVILARCRLLVSYLV